MAYFIEIAFKIFRLGMKLMFSIFVGFVVLVFVIYEEISLRSLPARIDDTICSMIEHAAFPEVTRSRAALSRKIVFREDENESTIDFRRLPPEWQVVCQIHRGSGGLRYDHALPTGEQLDGHDCYEAMRNAIPFLISNKEGRKIIVFFKPPRNAHSSALGSEVVECMPREEAISVCVKPQDPQSAPPQYRECSLRSGRNKR